MEPLEDAAREIYGRVISGQLDPDRATVRLLTIQIEARTGKPPRKSLRRSAIRPTR